MSEIRFTDYSELLPSRKSYRNVGNIEIDGIPIQEDIKQIRADAIDEFLAWFDSKYEAFEPEDDGYVLYGDMHYHSADELKSEYIEQIKGQTDEQGTN